jgi:hypothetical protein
LEGEGDLDFVVEGTVELNDAPVSDRLERFESSSFVFPPRCWRSNKRIG